MSFERYHEAVDYLQRRLWHDLPIVPVERALQSRIRHLLAHFGDPHLAMPVVHVGGSAGKGSTSTMIASILQASGARTGLYTGPHLQTFIERAAVDGRLMSPDEFADTVLGIEPLVRKMHLEVLDGVGFGRPSLVEVAFATGMRHFASERCDVAVVEVGLGGRTDCTNVFDQKRVSVITNIEYEHRERLGWTLTSIAREKAAIIRGGEIAVVGALRPEALAVIAARCAEVGATLWRMGHEVRVTHRRSDGDGSTFDVRTPLGEMHGLRVPLLGAHQAHERGAGSCGGAGVLRRKRRRHRGVCAIGAGGGAAERPAGVHAGVAPRAARRRAQPGRGATPRADAARAAGPRRRAVAPRMRNPRRQGSGRDGAARWPVLRRASSSRSRRPWSAPAIRSGCSRTSAKPSAMKP